MNISSKPAKKVSIYHTSWTKRSLDILLSFLGIVILSPIILLIGLVVKLTSPGPIFFIHKRVGKNGMIFKMIKFRTMVKGAEKLKSKYRKINEADGPVFKIQNDPRFTRVGKVLSRTGLDELPQLINVLKNEMSLVGPRPLPTEESNKINSKEKNRLLIKPGLTSTWVINGSHKLSFKEWMKLDLNYLENANLDIDVKVILKTVALIVSFFVKLIGAGDRT